MGHIPPGERPMVESRFLYLQQYEFNLPRKPTPEPTITIDNDKLQTLIGMGFDKDKATTALTEMRNNLARAVDVLAEGVNISEDKPQHSTTNTKPCDPSLIQQLVAMGFGEDQARDALIKSNQNLERALEIIFN